MRKITIGILVFSHQWPLNIKRFSEKVSHLQSCLLEMIKKVIKQLDRKGEHAALLTNLPNAFDCLPLDLIIEKLHACAFDKVSLRPLHMSLTSRYQRVKVKTSYSLWSLIKHGVHPGSILGLYHLIYFNVTYSS